MRVACYLLLLANLLFLAWAEWIAVPAVPAEVPSGVPRLQLVSRDGPTSPPAAGATQAPPGALSAALTAQAAAAVPAGAGAAPALQCLSVGPFGHDREARKAMAFLRTRNLAPRQRATAVQPVQWYWVYLPDLSQPARVQRVLTELRHDGLAGAGAGAEAMPTPDGKPGISLGLFQDASLAQRQLARAQAKGFAAKLSARLVAQPAYWLDVWVAGGAAALPLQTLNADLGGTFATQACPAGDTPPLPDDATGAATPGVPLPAENSTAASPP